MKLRIAIVGLILAGTTAMALAEDMNVVIADNGAPVLSLGVPAGSKVYSTPPKTTIVATNMYLYVWSVPGVQSTAEALPQIPAIIKDNVLDFKADQTNELRVADAPAIHLIGRGVEADDGDPSTADVVVFTVGTRAFVACVHGEHNDASRERQPMLAALQTAKAP